jgi:hypothetical protein
VLLVLLQRLGELHHVVATRVAIGLLAFPRALLVAISRFASARSLAFIRRHLAGGGHDPAIGEAVHVFCAEVAEHRHFAFGDAVRRATGRRRSASRERHHFCVLT